MKNDIVDAGTKIVEGACDSVDTMFYIIIGLVVTLVGAIGWLIYLLVFA